MGCQTTGSASSWTRSRGNARFECPDGESTLSVEHTAQLGVGPAPVVYLECADLYGTVGRLVKEGIRFDSLPTDRPWLWAEARLRIPPATRCASSSPGRTAAIRRGGGRARMTAPEFVVETDPRPDQVEYLEDRIYEFNSSVTGVHDGEWLAIFVRDDTGRIVAGICGNTWAGTARSGSSGSRSHDAAGGWALGSSRRPSAEARRRGCTQIFLMTFTFQAPAFYARHGFTTVAEVDEYPRGIRISS